MRSILAFFVAAFIILPGFADAAKKLPSYRIGNLEIILLTEGDSTSNTSLLISATVDQLKKHAPDGKYLTAVNAFLVRSPNGNILIDAAFGKTLFEDLALLGLTPEEINTVLLTHMHGDHIGGMMRDGKAAFPNAQVYLSEQELAYWAETDISTLNTGAAQGFIRARAVLEAYGQRITTFRPAEIGGNYNAEIMRGVVPVAGFGHTAGHTMYLLESASSHILFWGDLVHAMALQMPHPEIAITYDVDPRAATLTRLKTLGRISLNDIAVAGAHIPSPGMGMIKSDGKAGYIFTPFEVDDALATE